MTNKPVVFFNGVDSTDHYGLWVSDGTSTGTIELGGLTDSAVVGAAKYGLDPNFLDSLGNGIVFFGEGGSNSSLDLWYSDGTTVGTRDISDVNGSQIAGVNSEGLNPKIITNIGSEALFLGTDTSGYTGLWVTDGTSSGTTEIGGLGNAGVSGVYFNGITSGVNFYAGEVGTLPNGLVFTGDDSNHRLGLWFTDGTASGTVEIGGLLNSGIAGAPSGAFTYAVSTGGKVFFDWSGQLWVTDGTAAGTIELEHSIFTNEGISVFGNDVLVLADDGGYGGLYVSDGTVSGTTELGGYQSKGIVNSGSYVNGFVATHFTSLGTVAVFSAPDKDGVFTLWATDGTTAGTVDLGGLGNGAIANVSANGLRPTDFTVIGHDALFLGYDASGQQTLWVTDGTAAGTSELGGLNNSAVTGAPKAGLDPASIVVSGSLAYFEQKDLSGSTNLWVSDGTAAGTHEVSSAAGAAASLDPTSITAATYNAPLPIVQENGASTEVFTGSLSQYSIDTSGSSPSIADSVADRDGTVQLTGVQQAHFTDYTVAFDLHSSQDLLVYEIYQAAYNRVPDNAGFRYWAGVADANQTTGLALADAFLHAPEFTQIYGSNPSNLTYVTELYEHVLGRTPDQAGLDYWVGKANAGTPNDQLMVSFAISAENVSLIAPHIDNGYWTTH